MQGYGNRWADIRLVMQAVGHVEHSISMWILHKISMIWTRDLFSWPLKPVPWLGRKESTLGPSRTHQRVAPSWGMLVPTRRPRRSGCPGRAWRTWGRRWRRWRAGCRRRRGLRRRRRASSSSSGRRQSRTELRWTRRRLENERFVIVWGWRSSLGRPGFESWCEYWKNKWSLLFKMPFKEYST